MMERGARSVAWRRVAVSVVAVAAVLGGAGWLAAAGEAPAIEAVVDTGWRDATRSVVTAGWATIRGQGLGGGAAAGVGVTIGGQGAAVMAARSGEAGDELDVIVPRMAAGTAEVVVKTAAGSSAPFGVTVVGFRPSLMTVAGAAGREVDGTTLDGKERLGALETAGGGAWRPAMPMETVSLLVNGCGWWEGAPEPGTAAGEAVAFSGTVEVTVGGKAAEVVYAGVAPGRAGLCRVDVKLPGLKTGSHDVGLTMGGTKAQGGVALKVREAPYAGYDHTISSDYRLSGAHVFTECTACHVRSRFAGTPSACEACHLERYEKTASPDHAAAGFPTDCARCHTTASFRLARYGHAGGQFALTGRHAALGCGACHREGTFERRDPACAGCHLANWEATANPNHAATGLGKECAVCHTPEGWKGARADHTKSGFALTGKHATAACSACHAEGAAERPAAECVNCHQAQYDATSAPNHASAGYPAGCDACHTPSGWKPAKVDHPRERFELTGRHAELACSQCHQEGRYSGMDAKCAACHAKAYETAQAPDHAAAGYPKTCETCHTAAGWKGAAARHEKYELTGRHAAAGCTGCHAEGRFEGTPKSCEGCHLARYEAVATPDHRGLGFPQQCQLCHSTSQFAGARFPHARYELTGRHEAANCAACHAGGQYAGTARECAGCHLAKYTAAPNHVAAGYPNTCQSCHTTAGWKPSPFNHAAFALTGRHAAAKCSSCHSSGQYTGTARDCAGCHMAKYTSAPNHAAAGYPNTCQSCHTTAGWKPSPFTHAAFALTGRHAATKCSACHATGKYAGTGRECSACHMAKYNTAAQPNHVARGYPAACQMCHTTSGWSPATYSHEIYALTGRHAAVQCGSCHAGGRYSGTTRNCSGCHMARYGATTAPNHQNAGFPTDCQACHTTAGWTPAAFSHGTFALSGRHSSVTCAGCHAGGRYAGTPRDCAGCHLRTYQMTTSPNHAASGLPTACQNCHTTSGWRPASFAHTFPIYSGVHAGRWSSCASCHPAAGSYSQFTCSNCHSKAGMDNEHKGKAGYVYDAAACLRCHPAGRKP